MSGSYCAGGNGLADQLAEKGLGGYDVNRAYDAVDALFDGDTATVDAFVQPLDAYDVGEYQGDEPLSVLDQRFSVIMDDVYDSETGEQSDTLANEFVQADRYDGAVDALACFEEWTDQALDHLLNEDTAVVVEDLQLGSDEFAAAVRFHSLRRLVQRKHQYEQGEAELFAASDTGRDIDLAAARDDA